MEEENEEAFCVDMEHPFCGDGSLSLANRGSLPKPKYRPE
jgi:hypothetical protein